MDYGPSEGRRFATGCFSCPASRKKSLPSRPLFSAPLPCYSSLHAMRDALLLLVLLVGVLAVVVWFSPGTFTSSPSTSSTAPAATRTSTTPKPKASEPGRTSKARTFSARTEPALPQPMVSGESDRTPTPRVWQPPPPLPRLDPSRITPGLERTELQKLFGTPDVMATTLDRGSMFEKYFYDQKSNGRTIIADLRDGRVQRVRSARTSSITPPR